MEKVRELADHLRLVQADAQLSHVQAVQLLAVREVYLRCTSELSQEHLELMSHLSINLHVASLGMHRSREKGVSAARRLVGRLQSNLQRSSNAFVILVRECLVNVLTPLQVMLASSVPALSLHTSTFLQVYHVMLSCLPKRAQPVMFILKKKELVLRMPYSEAEMPRADFAENMTNSYVGPRLLYACAISMGNQSCFEARACGNCKSQPHSSF